MVKFKRVLFIDAVNRTITESKIRGLDDMQKLVGGSIECATQFENGDEVFVNEEGLFGEPQHFFDVGAHQPFAGNGFVIGECGRDGYSKDAKSTVEEIAAKLTWKTRAQVQYER